MESMSAVQLWSGRVLSGLTVLFLFVDAMGKLLKVRPVIDGTVELGYQEHVVLPLGAMYRKCEARLQRQQEHGF